MNDAVKMFSVLAGVTTTCGLLLAGAHDLTRERIFSQELRYTKGPAIRAVLTDATNDPLVDRKAVAVSGKEVTLFFGKKGGSVTGMALETAAQGYGGPLHVITGFDPESGKCKAIAVALSRETPGIGSRITGNAFTESFAGLDTATFAALRKDGGTIDAVSGATISSRAVCSAVAAAQKLFKEIRPSLSGGRQ
ncbi:MAG: RnfABCDGE type electron transport complex subunit G [Chitinispirillaceae bacterium]|nr:RnfABCDGE type electron transport complex subunit G [Chitinispirillaceae bacterium]